jgi:hypothetical protein
MKLTKTEHWPAMPTTTGPNPHMSAAYTVRTYHHPRLGKVVTFVDADAPNLVWLRSETLNAGLIAAGFLEPQEEIKIVTAKPKRSKRKRAGTEPAKRRRA